MRDDNDDETRERGKEGSCEKLLRFSAANEGDEGRLGAVEVLFVGVVWRDLLRGMVTEICGLGFLP